MFKVMWLMKRKPGTSMQDLIDYYENVHSKIGERFATGVAVKYIRRYLRPLTDPIPDSQDDSEPEYDVAMEMWFNSRADWDRLLEITSPEALTNMIIEDEQRFLDRSRRRVFLLEEHESELG